jgi:hypothetical protein
MCAESAAFSPDNGRNGRELTSCSKPTKSKLSYHIFTTVWQQYLQFNLVYPGISHPQMHQTQRSCFTSQRSKLHPAATSATVSSVSV